MLSLLSVVMVEQRGPFTREAAIEYEREMHEVVPGSQYLTLREAGHFSIAEQPAAVNQAIVIFLDTLCASQAPPPRGGPRPMV